MDDLNLSLKGVIACPNIECGKEIIFAYDDVSGHSSIRCYKCDKTIMIDYDTLNASIIPPKRRFNKKSTPSNRT